MPTTHADLIYVVLRNAKEPLTPLQIGQRCGLGSEQVNLRLKKVEWAKKVGSVNVAKGYKAETWQYDPAAGNVVAKVVAKRMGHCSNVGCDSEQVFCRGLCSRCYSYQRRHGRMWQAEDSEPNTEIVTFRLSAKLKQQLETTARRERRSMGEVIRRMLKGVSDGVA